MSFEEIVEELPKQLTIEGKETLRDLRAMLSFSFLDWQLALTTGNSPATH